MKGLGLELQGAPSGVSRGNLAFGFRLVGAEPQTPGNSQQPNLKPKTQNPKTLSLNPKPLKP